MADWTPLSEQNVGASKNNNPIDTKPAAPMGGLDWVPTSEAKSESTSAKIGNPNDFIRGIGSVPFKTVFQGGDIIRWMLGMKRVIDSPQVQDLMGANDDTLLGGAGQVVGEGAEMMAPIPGTAKLKAMQAGTGVIKRIALGATKDALQTGAWGTLNSGADPTASIGSAALGAVTGGVAGGFAGSYDNFAGLTQDFNPARAEATRWGQANNVFVDPATRTGSPILRNIKKLLSSGVNAPESERLLNEQTDQYNAAGQRLLTQAGAGRPPLDPDQAGNSAYHALDRRQAQQGQIGDQQFGGIRAQAQMMPVQHLQVTRWEQQPTGAVDQMGHPIMAPRQVTVQGTFRIPIDRTNLQATLRQWQNSLPLGSMSQVERDASPGLSILREIINGDSVVEATDAMQDLSSIFGAFKSERGKLAPSFRKFIGSHVIQEYRQTVDAGLQQANPGLLTAADTGRAAVREQHGTIRLMNRLGSGVDRTDPFSLKPVQFYQNLVAQKDKAIGLLQNFQTRAPAEIPKMAATTLQGLLDTATKAGTDGAFAHADAALTGWNNLGPRTKEILYGPLVPELDNFFRLGKYLNENPNPSNTGMHVWMAARLMNLFSHPGVLAKDTALEFAMGKYIFSQRGPLPLWNAAHPGVVNPAAASVAAVWQKLTGQDPRQYIQADSQQPVNGQSNGQTRP